MTESTNKKILVADREPGIRRKLSDFFISIGYHVESAGGDGELMSKLAADNYAVVLVDCQLTEAGGMDVLSRISATYPETPVIMLNSEPSLESVIAALREGAFDFIIKPLEFSELGEIVQKACDRHELLLSYKNLSVRMRQEAVLVGIE